MGDRLAIFGDTGAHHKQLAASLQELGVDLENFVIPSDLRIVHMGDLLHKGPRGREVVEVVDKLMARNAGRWLQILGNHELNHIYGGVEFWRCDCSNETIRLIEGWVASKQARYAWSLNQLLRNPLHPDEFSIDDFPESMLFTHAGLSKGFHKLLGSPATASDAAAAINEASAKELRRAGYFLGDLHEDAPSPIWALSSEEVIDPWLKSTSPLGFSQAMGHSSLYRWSEAHWYKSCSPEVRAASLLDFDKRVGFTKVHNDLFVTLDPDFDSRVQLAFQPYLLLQQG